MQWGFFFLIIYPLLSDDRLDSTEISRDSRSLQYIELFFYFFKMHFRSSVSGPETKYLVPSRSQKQYWLKQFKFVGWLFYVCRCVYGYFVWFIFSSGWHVKYFKKDFFYFCHFWWNEYFIIKQYLCHLCMVNKQEHTTSNAMSQISQVAFFFRGKIVYPTF